jgi:hypothetical protein
VAITYTKDSIGQEVEAETTTTVYANEFAISASSYYEAGRAGLQPEREYQIRAIDYQDQPRFRVGGTDYEIIRVDRRGEWTRLVGQRLVSNAWAVS